MKKGILFLFICLFSMSAFAKEPIEGLWVTIDDESGEAKSVVEIYAYQGQYYGRIVDLLKNKEARATRLPHQPKILGMDIIWDLKKDGKTFEDGQILDPKKGRVYGCEVWRKGENLIVRGKIAFLGRNQTWLPYKEGKLTAQKDLIPHKPEI
ncbi:MAG: DUF2147 domain-containing protein [Alphaproteobacteria bacterium]|nr:DUF2147 domain-containing protein [Alphaproteobacteria bacterium]